jgi:hypothetical protein
MGSFSEIINDSVQEKPKKGSSDFLRLTEEHQTVIRVLDKEPKVSWSHWVPRGNSAFPNTNGGKGMSFMCPGKDVCPICKWNAEAKAKNPKDPNLIRARRVFTFNVLDRTPVITCPDCGVEHYRSKSGYPTGCECGGSLKGIEPEPRNKVQILQKGIKVIGQLTSFEEDPDFGDLRTYDIKIDTRGTGTETITNCSPKPKSELDGDAIFTEDNQPFDIDAIIKPLSAADMKRILQGESFFDVVSNGA